MKKVCQNCGADEFIDESGRSFCSYCHTEYFSDTTARLQQISEEEEEILDGISQTKKIKKIQRDSWIVVVATLGTFISIILVSVFTENLQNNRILEYKNLSQIKKSANFLSKETASEETQSEPSSENSLPKQIQPQTQKEFEAYGIKFLSEIGWKKDTYENIKTDGSLSIDELYKTVPKVTVLTEIPGQDTQAEWHTNLDYSDTEQLIISFNPTNRKITKKHLTGSPDPFGKDNLISRITQVEGWNKSLFQSITNSAYTLQAESINAVTTVIGRDDTGCMSYEDLLKKVGVPPKRVEKNENVDTHLEEGTAVWVGRKIKDDTNGDWNLEVRVQFDLKSGKVINHFLFPADKDENYNSLWK